MNTTFNHERGFHPRLSRIIYVVLCLGLLTILFIPLLILLIYNLHDKPFTFTPRKPIVNNTPIYSLRLKI